MMSGICFTKFDFSHALFIRERLKDIYFILVLIIECIYQMPMLTERAFFVALMKKLYCKKRAAVRIAAFGTLYSASCHLF